jgi:CRISPR-associated endonuclease Csn1
MTKVLGLDIGPNSIGWALVDDNSESGRLIDCGVRVFPEGVDNFDTGKESLRGEQRRTARAMRRQIRRRRLRKQKLREALVAVGLWPDNPADVERLLSLDPYHLRRRATVEPLAPFEVGRVLLHLNQRRGFLSNRKTDRSDKEQSAMLQEIGALQTALAGRTLGEHLSQLRTDPHTRIRGKHTRRSMLVEEFDRIWTEQAKHHPDVLTDALRFGSIGRQPAVRKPRRLRKGQTWLSAYGIEGIIFFQRPMFWPTSRIGVCQFERGQRRCARADRAFQQFRMLQEVNNLRYIQPGGDERALTDDQRAAVLKKLGSVEKIDFKQLRKLLELPDAVRFNLERGERAKLDGHKTDYLLSKKDPGWRKRPEAEKDAIVRTLIDPNLPDADVIERLRTVHALPAELAATLAAVDLPAGYGELSLRAINKLLPFLQAGMRYQADSDPTRSAIHAAGYLREDEQKRRLFDRLPSLAFIRSGPLSDLANPVVNRALHELRKVVNAVVREYGRPDAIHVEMARSMKMGQEARKKYNTNRREREEARSKNADFLREKGIRVNRDNLLRLALWQEQRERCLYTGEAIHFNQLFGGEVDIDHIFPFSRSLDDSQANKVVCFRTANATKGDRTPYEWLADTAPEHFAAVLARVEAIEGYPYGKRRRFQQKTLDTDEFTNRQLVDTAYLTRLALTYVSMLVEAPHKQVLGLKGQYTAELRHQWGLETVLGGLPDSPAWAAQSDLRDGEKNRADHRHHTIDAIVVALTNRKRLHELGRIIGDGGTRRTGESLDDPWPRFRQTVVERVAAIKVSRRVERRVRGKLHEETVYGAVHNQQGIPKPGEFVSRKPVTALSSSEVERIRDKGVRRVVEAALKAAGIDVGRGKTVDSGKMAKALSGLRMPGPKGPPIHTVRVLRPELTIRPLRQDESGKPIGYVKPGSTHHLCIFEWDEPGPTGKTRRVRDAVFVTRLEAARRVRDGEPIIQRRHPERPEARFVMSLSAGEAVLFNWKGVEKLLVYRTAASTTKQMIFVEHTDARRSDALRKYSAYCATLDARKVTVDPIGRIRWAND